jgi:hypothetical protein
MEFWRECGSSRANKKKENEIDTGVALAEKIFFTRSIFDCAIYPFTIFADSRSL